VAEVILGTLDTASDLTVQAYYDGADMNVPLIEGEYRTLRWWKEIDPYKALPERSERCWACYRMRIEETARKAAELGIALFTTTLSVSPHKVHAQIVRIGTEILGAYSQLDPMNKHNKWGRVKGALEHMYWMSPGMTIAAGTTDTMRNIVGQFGYDDGETRCVFRRRLRQRMQRRRQEHPVHELSSSG
jgi:hypothetical protein